MLTLLEFTIFGTYLAVLVVLVALIQVYKPGQQTQSPSVVEDIYDVSDDESEKAPFNPEDEPYVMTENPIFSHPTNVPHPESSSKED
jgi:hypothetical protein